MRRGRARVDRDRTEDPALSSLVLNSIAVLDHLLCSCASPIPQEAPQRPRVAAGRDAPPGAAAVRAADPVRESPAGLHGLAAATPAGPCTDHLAALRRLVLASEIMDPGCAGHLVRLRHYTGVLAKALHVSPGEREILVHAVTLHDIGKVGVPDAIRFKPGVLTQDELRVMQSHTVIGGRLLANVACELLRLGRVIALTHHERWDGGGYPQRLRGEQIPLSGRICAVVDAYDAMTSERPHRAAMAPEAALEEMRRERGRQFDPRLLDLFFGRASEVLELRELLAEGAPAPVGAPLPAVPLGPRQDAA